jgi:predicted O-methyltransferase YrrM
MAREAAQRLGVDPRYLRRIRWVHKARAVRGNKAKLRDHLRFVLLDPEPDNFTYQVANAPELARWAAAVVERDVSAMQAFVAEPAEDEVLQARLRSATAGRWFWTKAAPPFGKRLAWYALARALTPKLIVETGAHDGLASLLLLRALERNIEENKAHTGRLVSFDVNPASGWLVGSNPLWELRIQPSQSGLADLLRASGCVDMFIYDGWHTHAAEHKDLAVAEEYLSSNGILLSDDAQVTHALEDLCRERGLRYLTVQEVPTGHFYPGTVLGAGRKPTHHQP